MQTIVDFLGCPDSEDWEDRVSGCIRGIDSSEIVVYDDNGAPPLSPLECSDMVLIGPCRLVLPGTSCSVREESVQVHLHEPYRRAWPIPLFFSPAARRSRSITVTPCGQQRP